MTYELQCNFGYIIKRLCLYDFRSSSVLWKIVVEIWFSNPSCEAISQPYSQIHFDGSNHWPGSQDTESHPSYTSDAHPIYILLIYIFLKLYFAQFLCMAKKVYSKYDFWGCQKKQSQKHEFLLHSGNICCKRISEYIPTSSTGTGFFPMWDETTTEPFIIDPTVRSIEKLNPPVRRSEQCATIFVHVYTHGLRVSQIINTLHP